jgi:hypothetical protein
MEKEQFCLICNKKFISKYSKSRNKFSKYCSIKCRDLSKIGKKKSNKKLDIKINDIFGNLIVLEKINGCLNKHHEYKCLCRLCNSIKKYKSSILIKRTDCGCNNFKDITGIKKGKITVLRMAGKERKYGRSIVIWEYICNCGRIKKAAAQTILAGDITSCGKCKPTGKDHFAYNPNYDRYNRRDSSITRRWTRKVFERDNFKCRICGIKGKKIQAHHLDGWNWCKEKRFDINNGITLCCGKNSCHSKFHKIFGSGYNTAEEFGYFYSFYKI